MKTGDRVRTREGEIGIVIGEETNRAEYRYGVKIDDRPPLWYFKCELTLIKDECYSNKTQS